MSDRVQPEDLHFVSAVSDWAVAQQRLLASPCLQPGRRRLTLQLNATSAAQAVNPVLDGGAAGRWLVWLHQDVFLPEGWDGLLAQRLQAALQQWPDLAVAGVYGVSGAGAQARHAGHVLDRGQDLRGPAALPCQADSLDELLLVLRADGGLRLDAALGFDFYATDVVLQARQAGLPAVVLEAICEHWSNLPVNAPISSTLQERIAASAERFERKWQHALPVTTPCFDIRQPGDCRAYLKTV